jgi:hypothetical protein
LIRRARLQFMNQASGPVIQASSLGNFMARFRAQVEVATR